MSKLRAQFEKSIARHCSFVPANTFDYSVNISTRFNYLYVETPKVCCSTIKSVLQRAELNDPMFSRTDFEDIHLREFSPLLRPSQVGDLGGFVNRNKPFSFCFCRNPYSRLLSAYLDKIRTNRPQKRSVLLHLGRDVSDLSQKIGFDEFVRVVCEQPIATMDSHWRPQYYQTFQKYFKFDFIGRLERFDEDFRSVLDRLVIDACKYMADERRHSQGADVLLKEFYTPELLEAVRAKYAVDFDYFRYPSIL